MDWNTTHRQSLDGAVVLVSGAGSGLGTAAARAFAETGCAVACVDGSEVAAGRVARGITERGRRTLALGCDVSNPEGVEAAVVTVIRELGGLDVLVNNAATEYGIPIGDMTMDEWEGVIDAHLRGPFLFSKTAFPILRERGGGHIVNIASTTTPRTWVNAAASHSAKWELVGLGRKLDAEGTPFDIRVTTIVPGDGQTYFFDQTIEENLPPHRDDPHDLARIADAIVTAVRMPREAAVGELLLTPVTQTGWH